MKLDMKIFIAGRYSDWYPHFAERTDRRRLFWKQSLTGGEEDNMKTASPWVGGEDMMDCGELALKAEAEVVDAKPAAAQI